MFVEEASGRSGRDILRMSVLLKLRSWTRAQWSDLWEGIYIVHERATLKRLAVLPDTPRFLDELLRFPHFFFVWTSSSSVLTYPSIRWTAA